METASNQLPALEFVTRAWVPSTDRPFVADSWCKTIRGSTLEARRCEESSFFSHYNRVVDAILDSVKTRVRVATPPEDDATIYGYVVHSPPDTVHMAFVKKPLRGRGIARKLLDGIKLRGSVLTQWSRDMGDWILPKLSTKVGVDSWGRPIWRCEVTYDPFSFLEKQE